MAASTSREENLARMGLEKFVQTTIVAEQLDNTLLHAQGQLNHTLTELQTLPAKVSERIALCIRFGIHVTPAKVESIIANHLRFKKKHLQKELCLIDENRQKLLKDLEQFPKLAERVFTQHDYCDRGNLSTSYNLSTWFMLDDSSWSQLYDHRDIFSDSVSIPTTLKPYEPWRKEMDCSPRDDCLKDWPEYRYQRQYPEPTQIAAFEQDDDEEEIKDMRTDKEIKDDDSASPSAKEKQDQEREAQKKKAVTSDPEKGGIPTPPITPAKPKSTFNESPSPIKKAPSGAMPDATRSHKLSVQDEEVEVIGKVKSRESKAGEGRG